MVTKVAQKIALRSGISRRVAISSLATTFLVIASRHRTGASELSRRRVVALDLPAMDICTFAGLDLIGAASAARFRHGLSDFPLAADVTDIGTSDEPNLELLIGLKPDIIVSAWPRPIDPRLPLMAPIIDVPIFTTSGDRYEGFATAVRQLGELGGSRIEAVSALDQAEALLASLAARLDSAAIGPVLLATLNNDGSLVRVYGQSSIIGSTLQRLGLINVWTGPDSIWGWSNIRPEALRQWPDAHIVEVTQYWDGAALMRKRLVRGAVWRALPQVKAGRVLSLRPIAVLGGLWTSLHFASLITDALTETQS